MATERLQDGVQSFVRRMNEGFQYPTHLLYEKIGDPIVRAAVRTGELIAVAAISKGVDLPIPRAEGPDEWLLYLPQNLLRMLKSQGPDVAKDVLKEARRIVRASSMNGDRQKVLDNISELLSTLRPQVFKLPPLPVKVGLEFSASKK